MAGWECSHAEAPCSTEQSCGQAQPPIHICMRPEQARLPYTPVRTCYNSATMSVYMHTFVNECVCLWHVRTRGASPSKQRARQRRSQGPSTHKPDGPSVLVDQTDQTSTPTILGYACTKTWHADPGRSGRWACHCKAGGQPRAGLDTSPSHSHCKKGKKLAASKSITAPNRANLGT